MSNNTTISLRVNSEILKAIDNLKKKNSVMEGRGYLLETSEIIRNCILYCDSFVDLNDIDNYINFYKRDYFYKERFKDYYKNVFERGKKHKITTFDKNNNTRQDCITNRNVLQERSET